MFEYFRALADTILLVYVIALCINSTVWGAACYFIVKNKGYGPSACAHYFAGGAALSIIWLIVSLCKSDNVEKYKWGGHDGGTPASLIAYVTAIVVSLIGLVLFLKVGQSYAPLLCISAFGIFWLIYLLIREG